MATVSAAKDQLQNVNHVPGNGMMGKSSAKRGQGMRSYQIDKHSIASETLVPAAALNGTLKRVPCTSMLPVNLTHLYQLLT